MEKLNLKNCLYHGIVDWNNYTCKFSNDDFCLSKLSSILKTRYILRPCDFRKNGITHGDVANVYTHYFTFVACHPDSEYAVRFKKDIEEDNGYMVATEYANFGILLSPKIINELPIWNEPFCDKEIPVDANISLDQFGLGIYINSSYYTTKLYEQIKTLLNKYNYDFDVIRLNNKDKNIISKAKEKVLKK